MEVEKAMRQSNLFTLRRAQRCRRAAILWFHRADHTLQHNIQFTGT